MDFDSCQAAILFGLEVFLTDADQSEHQRGIAPSGHDMLHVNAAELEIAHQDGVA